MRPRPFMILLLVGAAAGLFFASFSTYDFVQHVDRQVHAVHCSFVPGLAIADASGASGCQVAMMSPYSSVFRSSFWGGIPISLPAMAVFAFLLFLAVELVLSRRQNDPRATGFLALATAVPLGASLVMGTISFAALGVACKLCIGIYLASIACFVGALVLWRRAVDEHRGSAAAAADPIVAPEPRARAAGPTTAEHGDPVWVHGGRDSPAASSAAPSADMPAGHGGSLAEREAAPPPAGARHLAAAIALGVLFVAVPLFAYVRAMPEHDKYVGACGGLAESGDRYGVMVPLGAQSGGAPAIEVLDPLCPACRAFEQRLIAARLGEQMDRKALLFPLDNTCNWMVESTVHPGACTVSEAVLCAGDQADAVVAWAFAEQDLLREAAAQQPGAEAQLLLRRFPELKGCLGTPAVKSKLNKSLRWAVKNHLPVLTPQLYIAGVKLCDEDVDLGLDFALSQMLAMHRAGTLKASDVPEAPAHEPWREPVANTTGGVDPEQPVAATPAAAEGETATPPGASADEIDLAEEEGTAEATGAAKATVPQAGAEREATGEAEPGETSATPGHVPAAAPKEDQDEPAEGSGAATPPAAGPEQGAPPAAPREGEQP